MNTDIQNDAQDSRGRIASQNPRGCAIPGRAKDLLFRGWGPRLMGVAALAVAAGLTQTATLGATQGSGRGTCAAGHDAPALARVQQPGWPDAYFQGRSAGVVGLEVELDESANIRNVRVARSSGDSDLDQAAKRLAEQARFVNPDGACHMTPSTYGFTITSLG